jgi:hypothetical protein
LDEAPLLRVVDAKYWRGYWQIARGETAAATAGALDAVAAARALGDVDRESVACSLLAFAGAAAGDAELVRKATADGFAAAEQSGSADELAYALLNTSGDADRDPTAVRDALLRALDLTAGNDRLRMPVLVNLTDLGVSYGEDPSVTAQWAERAVALTDEYEHRVLGQFAYGNRGVVRLLAGDLEGAATDVATALGRAVVSGHVFMATELLLVAACIVTARGDGAGGAQLYSAFRHVLQDTGQRDTALQRRLIRDLLDDPVEIGGPLPVEEACRQALLLLTSAGGGKRNLFGLTVTRDLS